MKTFTIHIKNMICSRCIHVVKQILTDLGIEYSEVDLGYAVLNEGQPLDLQAVNQRLEALDLGLVRDPNEVLVTEINKAIHEYLDHINLLNQKLKLSQFIAQKLARNYHQLSKVYSHCHGTTIEQYFIELRTNMVKELIKQGKLNLSQIAINVGYSSIHYLSGQFKKLTGQSLTQYKKEWEASLIKRENDTSVCRVVGNETKVCDCGCLDCPCDEKGLSSLNSNRSNLALMKKNNGLSIDTWPGYQENFGEFKVYQSAKIS